MVRPNEYLKIKYAAPTEACKCGDCQLVPPGALREWDDEIIALKFLSAATPELLRVLKAVHRALVDQNINFGPLIADAEAAIAKAEKR